MKLFFYILFLSCLVSVSGQKVNESVLTLPSISYDFGYILQNGGKVKHRFIVENRSDSSFVITNVRSTCNCASPLWTQLPIKPGSEGFVDVEFDPKGYKGAFYKTIQVQSTASNANMFLTISGNVIPPVTEEELPHSIGDLKIKKNRINLGYLYKGTSRDKSITVYNPTKKPMAVTFDSVPEYVSLTVIPPVLEPQTFGQVELTYCTDKTDQWYILSDRIIVECNGKPVKDEKLFVTANIREDFRKLTPEQLQVAPVVSYNADSVVFDTITNADIQECSFLISNNGKTDLKIRAIQATCGCTVVRPEKTTLAPGDSTYIRATFNPANRSGKVSNGITVITNDPKQYKKQLYIDAVVNVDRK